MSNGRCLGGDVWEGDVLGEVYQGSKSGWEMSVEDTWIGEFDVMVGDFFVEDIWIGDVRVEDVLGGNV